MIIGSARVGNLIHRDKSELSFNELCLNYVNGRFQILQPPLHAQSTHKRTTGHLHMQMSLYVHRDAVVGSVLVFSMKITYLLCKG